MSHLDQDSSTCDSDPLKLEVDYEICVETTPNFETSTVEVFVKEESSSSSSSSSESDEDSQDVDFEPDEDSQDVDIEPNEDSPDAASPIVEPDEDSQNSQDVDIEPHNAVSVEFGDCTSVCSAPEVVQNPTTNYTTPPVVNWPVLEINPGGFRNNDSIDEEINYSATAEVKTEVINEECPPQIDVSKYLLMADQNAHSETRKMYSCAKCDASFDVIFELTRHLRTHVTPEINEEELKKKRKEEYFIECVRQRPCLWDKASPAYRNIVQKEKAWRKLGAMFNIKNIYMVKLRWTNLRDMHRFCFIKQKSRLFGPPKSKEWEYMEMLNFLIPTYTTQKAKPSIPEDIVERLISSVRRHPCLWDKSKKVYKNYDAKESAWFQITRECQIKDVQTTKTKWKHLVDTYRSIANKSGASESRKNLWKYYSLMKFIPPYRSIKEKVSVTNLLLKHKEIQKKSEEK